MTDPAAFIRAHTVLTRAPFVPEVALYLATEITPIWRASEDWLRESNIEPPFWAFAWPGGLALARHVLDNPHLVAGKRVLDFAAGCGVAAIACMMAGAAQVDAAEIDPLAVASVRLNALENAVDVTAIGDDLVGAANRWDLIICGDVCYEAPMTAHILPWLRGLAREADVWVADPGRAYLPTDDAAQTFATYTVPTTRELEDRPERTVRLFTLAA